MKYILIRDVTIKECDWLAKTLKFGTIVEEVSDQYNCCSNEGIPCKVKDEQGYFEIPISALIRYTDFNVN